MTITIACRSLDELFNLGVSQIFAGPDLGIGRSLRSRRRLGPREFDDRQPAQFGATGPALGRNSAIFDGRCDGGGKLISH